MIKEQLKEKLTYENAKAVAKQGVELAKAGGQHAVKVAMAVYTGSIEVCSQFHFDFSFIRTHFLIFLSSDFP